MPPGTSLHRFYARLPTSGSCTPSGSLQGGGDINWTVPSTLLSVVGQTSSQSVGNSVCNVPRKRKADGLKTKRRRSNPVVVLLNPDDPHIPIVVAADDGVIEVVALSSGGSIASISSGIVCTGNKGKEKLPECEDLDDEEDEEFGEEPAQKKPKKSYEASRKFQETWAARLPWAELHRGGDGLYDSVKCLVCSAIEGRDKILGPKWDTLMKHGGKRKATRDMPNGIKKDQCYHAKNCRHLRNERIFAGRSRGSVLDQVTAVKGERARKQIQLSTVFHLLHEGRPMREYEALQPLLCFLGVPKMPKRHWSDSAGWELAECLFNQVQRRTKIVMQEARFFSVTCDEVSTLDNQSWVSIHGYVCEDWQRKPVLLSLERVVDGVGSDSMTKVIINAIKTNGGIQTEELASRLASFGADGINTFQGKRTGVVQQLKTNWAPRVIGIHCMAHRTNLAAESLSGLPIVSRIEEMLQKLHAFFAHSPKRHLEFQKLAEVMHSKGLKILKNIKTRWISMLSPAVRVMNEYKVLLVKMQGDSTPPEPDSNGKAGKKDKLLMKLAKRNLAYLSDFKILLGLAGLLPMLRSVHSLIKFSQSREVFICDYVAAIQICISELQSFYLDNTSAFQQDLFWDFKGLYEVRHDAIPMSWVGSALDLNESGLEYLHFTPVGHSIQAFDIDSKTGTSSPITRELHANISEDVKAMCKGAAELLINQLQQRFPASTLMDAFGIVYPQYWMVPEAEQNFTRHLRILEEHYGYTKDFGTPKEKKKQRHLEGGVVAEATKTTEPILSDKNKQRHPKEGSVAKVTKTAEPILSIGKLEEQAQMFVISMKANCEGAMAGDLPLNPLTRLWRRLEASGLLRHKLSEYLKVVELAVVAVLGSVEDERTFSTLSFMKNKLRNRLSNHLPLVVAMHAQEFYTLTDFPYNAAYDD